MSAPPFMPLYVGDYLADTTHLTCTEHGAYMLLLMSMWRNGGSLPSDDKNLARHARCTTGQWARMRPILIEFFTVTDTTITHGRLTSELTRHSDAVERQRERSSNGGRAKALKYNAVTHAAGTEISCQPEPEPDTKEAKAPLVTPRLPALAKTEIARGFLAFWTAYPKRAGKDAAGKAFAKAMARIGGDDPLAVILAGIERALPGWDDPQFIPHPATWLNQGRWEDETPTIRTLAPRAQNGSSAKLAARHDNYAASYAGADLAADLLASRRAL